MSCEDPSGGRLCTLEEMDNAILSGGAPDVKLTVDDAILLVLYADPIPVRGVDALAEQVLLAVSGPLARADVEPVAFGRGRSGRPRSEHVECSLDMLALTGNVKVSGGRLLPGGPRIRIAAKGSGRIAEEYALLPAGSRAALARQRAGRAGPPPPLPASGRAIVRNGKVLADRPLEKTPGASWDVFISYAHKDGSGVAGALEAGLIRRGLRAWRDESQLSAGDTVSTTIMEALERSSHAVVILSPTYADSRYTMVELGGMLSGRRKNKIIPILYKTTHAEIAPKLPMLADTLMRTWSDNPEPLMAEIEQIVKAAKEDDAAPREGPVAGGAADKDLIDEASRGAAMSISCTIDGGAPVGRGKQIGRSRQICEIKEILDAEGMAAIVGDRGSGKSALSRLLYEDLAESGTALLVRCDDHLGAESAEELDRDVVPGRSLADMARRASSSHAGPLTVIFDSLDAAGRSEGTMRAFRRLVGMARGAGARTIVTVRSYDYNYSPALGGYEWGKRYDLGPLADAEIDEVLDAIKSPPAPPALRALLAVPLNLRLLSQILEKSPEADLASIRHEIGLYNAHWHCYVELDTLNTRVRDEIYRAAEGMLGARRTAIPYVPDDREAAEEAQSLNILERGGGGGSMIRFFHHAYMDYAMSRALLERHRPMADYLRADEHNVFLLPTLSLTFAMAHERDPDDFSLIVREMAQADIKHYWKSAAFAALAAVPHDQKCGACLRLEGPLADKLVLQRHFLMALAKQPPESWFPLWAGALAEWAADPGNYNGWFIAGCLEKAAKDGERYHARAFDAAKALAVHSRNGRVRKKAAEMLAGIVGVSGKVALLEALSADADPRVRSGVASNLPSLLETSPDAVPSIFCNLYLYEETSGEKTEMGSYGTLRMTSTRAQDDSMIRWDLDEKLPDLIRAYPCIMLRAAVMAAERAVRRPAANDPGGDPVSALLDAGGWSPLSDGRLLGIVGQYVAGCGVADFGRIAPVLAGTDILPFRRMLIDGMARHASAHLDDLADILSDPRTYEAPELRQSVRGAIGAVRGLLGEARARRIYGAISESNAPRAGTEDEMLRSKRARAAYLSELPRTSLSARDRSIVDRYSRPASEDVPITIGPFHEIPSKEAPEQDPLSAVTEMLPGYDLGRREKITLLNSMLKVIGDARCGLDEAVLSEMEAFLLRSKDDPDPDQDDLADHGNAMVLPQSVRGLAAECLIGILARRKRDAALDAVLELSEDPVNLVRGDVARSLPRLLPDHYKAARSIAMSYSQDPDPRVQFFLPAILTRILQKEPAAASAMIGNVLAASSQASRGIASLLLGLAIAMKEPRAVDLLGRVAGGGTFGGHLREDMPFVLKDEYLGTEHEDAALDLLYRLLGDPDPKVRHKAALFTLGGFDGNPDIDNRSYIAKIGPHLGRMVDLLGGAPLDMGVAEPLATFLEKFWAEVPGAALASLEAIAGHGAAATSEASMADRSLSVLAGLLHHHSLYDAEWDRCIDVLDKFAAVGWPAAMDMLAEMGRRD